MFVFSRRSIQHCLDQLSEVLSADQLSTLVKRLNQMGKHRFATSWEPCILYSLSRLGTVSYESPIASRRKPDVSFIYPGERTIAFVADITAISDEGLHNANPFQYFVGELERDPKSLNQKDIHTGKVL